MVPYRLILSWEMLKVACFKSFVCIFLGPNSLVSTKTFNCIYLYNSKTTFFKNDITVLGYINYIQNECLWFLDKSLRRVEV